MSSAALRPRRRFARWPDRRIVTRIAFGVIVVFVTAQALWWLYFQYAYVGRISEERLASWQAEAAFATSALARAADPDALAERLTATRPHLQVRDDVVRIDPQAREAFLSQQRGYQRMLAWEGPFFVVVVLGMLALIAGSLRQERALKRSQQNFLSAVTHEFTTPLATLRLLIQTAQMRELAPERRREYLARMASEVDRLERTSAQVLAAARLEQSPDAPRLQPCDLRRETEGYLSRARDGLAARGGAVVLKAPDAPLPVSLEPEAFALVLQNLLDNAVKYGRPRTVQRPAERKRPAPEGATIEVRLEDRGHLLALHVDDAGPGVPESDRDRIFDRFWRRGDESTRSATGTGLGLYLVRRTVEAMNGWVTVHDAPNGGARFTVTLPKRVGALPPEGAP